MPLVAQTQILVSSLNENRILKDFQQALLLLETPPPLKVDSFELCLSCGEQELSKFINHCNEIKAATAASKEGAQLSIIKTAPESSTSTTKK